MSLRAPRVVAFFHTYMPDGKLDTFMEGLAAGFLSCGVELHVIKANDLVLSLGANAYSSCIDEKKLLEHVHALEPDFVFSTNRAGIGRMLIDDPRCPIVTWLVDNTPFMHHGGTAANLYGPHDYVFTAATNNVRLIERDYPNLQKGRVLYLPFATSPEEFNNAKSEKKDIPISFVGTYFYSNLLTKVCAKLKGDRKSYAALMDLIAVFETSYEAEAEAEAEKRSLVPTLRDLGLSPLEFKNIVSNAVSLNYRLKVLDAVADLGLKLYGTDNWIEVYQSSLPTLRAFQIHDAINTREKLVNIYQRSKIAINVSHQQAIGGLPYRIYDLMASSAMLLADEESRTDLEHLFGKDCPVPLYRSPEHARELAAYYLAHEDERVKIVGRCNELVAKGFRFSDRVRTMFATIGKPLPETRESGTSSANKDLLRQIEPESFTKDECKQCYQASSGGMTMVDKRVFTNYFRPLHLVYIHTPPRIRAPIGRILRERLPPSLYKKILLWL